MVFVVKRRDCDVPLRTSAVWSLHFTTLKHFLNNGQLFQEIQIALF